MKTRISGITALFIFFTAGVLSAQEYKITVQNPKETRLILKDFSGALPIEGYSGNDIIITSTSGKIEPPERAKGLKPIFPAGTDNTGIGLDVKKSDNQITVSCLIPFTEKGEYKIKVPESLALELSSECQNSSDISIKDMKNEIDIKNCNDIDLARVTGPLVLSTISGNITVSFSSVNSSKASSINSISGDIDITLPSKTATDVELRTITGSFYSDFDFAESQKNMKKVGGNELKCSLNGGGFKFAIYNVSGNTYLRKGN